MSGVPMQGPQDTDEDKLRRLPNVVGAYARSLERLNANDVWPVDSSFASILRRAEAALRELAAARALNSELAMGLKSSGERISELLERIAGLERDAGRLEFYLCGDRNSKSDALVNLELRAISGDRPTLDEWRTAIDAAKEEK